MIAKGNLHGAGAQLAAYLLKGDKNELASLIETRGLEGFGYDPVSAFDALQQVADAQTNSTKPFFHAQTRNPDGEHLTDAQWLEVANREEKRLGFEGQPRILSFHTDLSTGEKHLHAAWFRIDLDTMRAIDPGLFKNDLKQVARECERDFGLTELDNNRQPHDRARIPDRDEVEESRRLGTDVRAIRTAILDCFEHSDNGASFKAALEAKDLILANGDKRDCLVVIDAEGGHHALNKKLTGQTLAVTRDRLSDLDRSQLPSVEQAKAMQADRQQASEITREARQQPAAEPIKETWAEAVRSFQERPEPAVEVRPQPAAEPIRETWAEAVRSFQVRPEPKHHAQESKPAEQSARPVFEVSATAIEESLRTPSRFMRFAEKILEFALSVLESFIGSPRNTPVQAEQKEKAATNEETLHAQGYVTFVQAKEAEYDARAHTQKTQDQYEDLMASKLTGRPPTREANVGRDDDREDDYRRERERER